MDLVLPRKSGTKGPGLSAPAHDLRKEDMLIEGAATRAALRTRNSNTQTAHHPTEMLFLWTHCCQTCGPIAALFNASCNANSRPKAKRLGEFFVCLKELCSMSTVLLQQVRGLT